MASPATENDSIPSTHPQKMKAWVHTSTGLPEKVLACSNDIPFPHSPVGEEVLVKISHAALNPGGSIMMQICPMLFRAKPAIPEMDFAGTIVQVGPIVPESQGLRAGTEVFGSVLVSSHIRAGKGSLAEFVLVSAENVCLKPENMSLKEAAGLPVAGCTALALFDSAKLEEGMKILINGASGGIGSMALQIARSAVGNSGKIVAICSKANIEMVKGLGADEVIDYQEHAPVHKFLTTEFANDKFDVVMDAFGIQEIFHNCEGYLKPGKAFVNVGPAMPTYSMRAILYSIGQMASNFLWPRFLGGPNRPYIQFAATATQDEMQRLAAMVREGKLKVPIDSCWDMEDVLKAYERMLSRHARGKVIVKI
ncbi:zinc ion binding [Cadophora gregata]|uniref:zinc ion binding n=1 Tax=Cadophora gregata TaxID=51156 RepID=UPI0026DC6DBB|nr:zinc ion binding [Cadophora gregata]KAK0113515.1 zinc ion binding [Cadophora gregata f. sp. sojae]KAK0114274.1 zinc ion binding [Cadophora gregata]